MASVTEICNRAIQHVGGEQIVSIDDSSKKSARECKRAYNSVLEATLRKNVWSFAKAQASLPALAEEPVHTFARYFQLPEDCLRLLPTNDRDLDWALHGRKIATNYSAPLEIEYIRKVTNPEDMDALFREAFAAELALAICDVLTGSNVKKTVIREDLREIMADAKRVNAVEKLSDELPEDDWISVRM